MLPVLHRLLLDSPALLGAVAADEGRVREGRRPDAAGRARRGRDTSSDPALHGAAVRGHAAAVLRRAASASSTSSSSMVLGPRLHRRRDRASTAVPTGAARCSCTCSRWPTSRCCSARWSPTRSCSLRRSMMTDVSPRKNIRTGLIVCGDLHVHVRHHLRGGRRVHLMSPLEPEVPPAARRSTSPARRSCRCSPPLGITMRRRRRHDVHRAPRRSAAPSSRSSA